MIVAAGDVELGMLIDGLIGMAKNTYLLHELNEKTGLGTLIHPDGWGIAYLWQNEWVFKKSTRPVFDDRSIHSLRKIKTKLAILHARKSSGTKISIQNTHPFYYDYGFKGNGFKEKFVFCHNGDIKEPIHFNPSFEPAGQTDSEKLFYSLLSAIEEEIKEKIIGRGVEENNRRNEKKNMKKNKEREVLDAIRSNLASYKPASGINFILSTKNESYVACKKNNFPKYYQMSIGTKNNFIVASSEKLPNLKNVTWKPLPQGKVAIIDHKKLAATIVSIQR